MILGVSLRKIFNRREMAEKGESEAHVLFARLCFKSVIVCAVPADNCNALGAATTDSAENGSSLPLLASVKQSFRGA